MLLQYVCHINDNMENDIVILKWTCWFKIYFWFMIMKGTLFFKQIPDFFLNHILVRWIGVISFWIKYANHNTLQNLSEDGLLWLYFCCWFLTHVYFIITYFVLITLIGGLRWCKDNLEPRLLRKCASKGTNFKTAITKGLVGSI